MNRRRRTAAALTLAALSLLVTGCYSYSPVETGTAEAGTEVRLKLNDEGVRAVRAQGGRDRGGRLQGRLVATPRDSLVLRVAEPIREPALGGTGSATGVRHRRIAVPGSGVDAVETRSLSLWKTGGLAAGGALALRLFLELPDVIGGGGSGPIDSPPDGQPAAVPYR